MSYKQTHIATYLKLQCNEYGLTCSIDKGIARYASLKVPGAFDSFTNKELTIYLF